MYKSIIILILILLDLFSKRIVFNFIDLNNSIYLNPFFDLIHIHNFGVSFGLFSNIFPSWFLIFIGLFIIAFIIFLLISSQNLWERRGYSCILAGAFGNVFDRMINGYVIDFIYFHYYDFYWPAFNFADIYISVGVLIIVLQIFNDLRKRGNT